MGCLLTSEIIEYMNKDKLDERIVILPILNKKQIGSDGIDIRLSGDLFIPSKIEINYLNPLMNYEKFQKKFEKMRKYIKLDYGESFTIHPGEFIIGNSFEYLCLPKNIMALIQGRSFWGRLGLIVHATAGVIHPKFQGVLTFELSNLGPVPIKLYPLMRIAQIIFYHGDGQIDEDIEDSQFAFSVRSKGPNITRDYDFPVLNKIKENRTKNLKED
ncbi:MAG: dCTP deaminase [Promethearchaeota archaeon]